MPLKLATLNVKGLRDPGKCVRLLGELLNLRVNVAAVQETHFTCTANCRVVVDDYIVISAYGSRSSIEVSLLIGCSLNVDVNLADDGGYLVVADIAVKSFEFWVVVVYAPNIVTERVSFFWQLVPTGEKLVGGTG